MLVTERVGASLEATRSDVEGRAGRDEKLRAEVAPHLIRFADQRAWKVRPESVHVRRADGTPNEWTTTYTALWAPRAVRFVGGEYDGETVNLPGGIDAGGFPLQIVTLPYRHSPMTGYETHPDPTSNPSYRRIGIDPIEDVWVYEFVAQTRRG